MDSAVSESEVAAPPLPDGEDMKAYVVRRALEVKRYGAIAGKTGVNVHWLRKLARGWIQNPNYNDIRTLSVFYRQLELGQVSL